MGKTPSPTSARSLFVNLVSEILWPKSRGCIFCSVLDLFDVLNKLTSSCLRTGVFGGEPACRKLTGTLLLDVVDDFGMSALILPSPPVMVSVLSALVTCAIGSPSVAGCKSILSGVLLDYCGEVFGEPVILPSS